MHGTPWLYGRRNWIQLRRGGKDQGSATSCANQSCSRPIIREAAELSRQMELISGSRAVLMDVFRYAQLYGTDLELELYYYEQFQYTGYRRKWVEQ
jgi:hypothetical protein